MSRFERARDGRAAAPVVGVAVLLAVTVVVSGVIAVSLTAVDPGSPAPRAAFSLTADASADRLALRHLGGDVLDVRELSVRVRVDDTPLVHQPPVPFFAARGFGGGPSGPFNAAADPRWHPGERASFRVAGTNAPAVEAGSVVSVTISVDGVRIATLRTTAT